MKIGYRIAAKEKAYYGGDIHNLTIRMAWFPMIEVDGRMVYIKDHSLTGKLEAETLGEALKLAARCRDAFLEPNRAPVWKNKLN